MVGLPYGRIFVKISKDHTEEIPNTLRNYKKAEIFRLYNLFLEESDLQEMKIPRSTVYKLLDYLAASKRKALKCVDNFIVDGSEVPYIITIKVAQI